MTSYTTRTTLLLLALAGCGPRIDSDGTLNAEQQPVVDAVQAMFDAMEVADTAGLRRVMAHEAQLFAMTPNGYRVSTLEQFIDVFAGENPAVLERMWNPEVRTRHAIATVWTQYDVYRRQEFSHCGIDAFHLARIEGSWKVTSVIYTVEPDGCPASPLGVPGR